MLTEKPVKIDISKRISSLPPYVFAELDGLKEEARHKGIDIIDLGIGNPDMPTPEPIIKAAIESIQKPQTHGYPSFSGKPEFKQAVANYMYEKFSVKLDNPQKQVQSLIGTKEGLAHLAMAYTDFGDINIVPDPYYPVHSRGTWLSGGEVYHIPLKPEHDFLPELDTIPEDVAERAKIFFVNYPNNPCAAVANVEFYTQLVQYCIRHKILLCSDLAYSEICFDGYQAPSIFNIPEADKIAIEFHTFSKSFNMAGWRIGFAIGNEEFIKTLYTTKTNVDYGASTLSQDAAIAALSLPHSYKEEIRDRYQKRRDILVKGFQSLGWEIDPPKATMYLWLKVPEGYTSKEWCKELIFTTGVVFTPGIAFGKYSDQYFRVSLVTNELRLQEALDRLSKYFSTHPVHIAPSS